MDGVLVDWTKQFEYDLDLYFPQLDFPMLREFTTPTHLPKEHRAAIDFVKYRPGFYWSMKPIEGSLEAMEGLAEEHDVWICSSPEVNNPTCASDKYNWLHWYMGSFWAERLILTRDKTLVDGDYLIDDRPDVHGVGITNWEQILFSQPYNDHVKNLRRLHGWANWYEELKDVLV